MWYYIYDIPEQHPGKYESQNHILGNTMLQGSILGNATPQSHILGNTMLQGSILGNAIPQSHILGKTVLQGNILGNAIPQTTFWAIRYTKSQQEPVQGHLLAFVLELH